MCDFLKAGTLLVIALTVLGCGETGEESPGEPAITAEAIEIGKALYADWDCAVCHGDDGEGTESGPGLSGLGDSWKLGGLAEYISEPERFIGEDPRLQKLKTVYPDMAMPAFDAIPADGRRALAAYVLSL